LCAFTNRAFAQTTSSVAFGDEHFSIETPA
jgi:hypothetical protein